LLKNFSAKKIWAIIYDTDNGVVTFLHNVTILLRAGTFHSKIENIVCKLVNVTACPFFCYIIEKKFGKNVYCFAEN